MPGGKHALFNFLIGIINSWPPSVPKKRYAHTLNECVAGPYMDGLIYHKIGFGKHTTQFTCVPKGRRFGFWDFLFIIIIISASAFGCPIVQCTS